MSQDQRRHIPPWLRRMGGWEETPDWLLDKIQEEQGGFSFLDLGITPEAAGFGSDAVPARDKGDEPALPEKGDEPAPQEKGSGSLTEIAKELRDAYERERRGTTHQPSTAETDEVDVASTEQEEGTSPSTRRRSGVTDWLTDLEEEASSDTEPSPPAEMRESSSWTAEWGNIPAEPATTDSEDRREPDVKEEESTSGRTGVTDWLTHMEEEPLEAEPPITGPESSTSTAPAEQTAIPDWLADLETAVPDAGTEEPDWLPDLQKEAGAEDEDLYADQETGTPAWLAGLQGEEEGEEIPAWLTELDSGGGINEWLAEQEEAAAAPPSSVEEDEQAFPSDVTETFTEAAEPAAGAPQGEAAASDAPADLEKERGDEEAPDWLRELDQIAEEQPPAPEQAAGIAQGDEEATSEAASLEMEIEDKGTPDWLRELDQIAGERPSAPDQAAGIAQGDEEATSETGSLELEIEDEGTPDWLRELDEIAGEQPSVLEQAAGIAQGDEEATSETGSLEMEIEDEGTPDWLRELDQIAAEQPSISEQADSTEDASDAFEIERGVEEGIQDDEVPDWLRDLAADEEGPESGALSEADATVPDAQLVHGTDVDEEDIDLGEDIEQEEVPDWLPGLAIDEDESEPEPRAEADASAPDAQLVHDTDVGEEESGLGGNVGEEGAPDWLRDLAIGGDEPEAGALPEADANAPDWLSFPEAPSAPSAEEEKAVPGSEPEQSPPAWMQEIYSPQREAPADQEALSLSSDEDLGEDETPDWLSALQGGGARSPRQGPAVETSGPLAGLGGVLSPEPILAIHPKSTFQPMPPVPDAHQAEAELVVRTLETPASRRIRVSRSAGREILNSLGRWVIYGLLIAIILTAPLRSLVQLPEFPEAQAFYSAIEGLQSGDQVLLVFDYDASLDGTLTPQARAIIWHLQHKGLGIVLLSLTPQGAAIARDLVAEREGMVAGEDYIDLGYLPPHPASLLAFMENPSGGAATLGTTRNPSQTMLGRQVQAFSSLDMVIAVSGDHEHFRWWIEQVQTKTPMDLLAVVPDGLMPYIVPYYGEMGTGQVTGVLGGLGPTAQYEELIGADFVPSARVSYVVQANALILFIGVVLVSGIGSLLTAQRRDAASRPLSSASGGN